MTLIDDAGLEPAEVDLVIDMWVVSSPREVGGALPVALAALDWASGYFWRSVAIAAGAFPASISTLPKNTSIAIRRHDAELYNDIIASGPKITPDFGDFGCASPTLLAGGRAPLPNLRYTADMDWQVFREDRALPGNQSFFTLCQRVVVSPYSASMTCARWCDVP